MSRENIEVVREAFDAFEQGDMRRFGDVMDPQVVTYAPEGWPEGGPFVGREDSLREFERLQTGKIAEMRFFWEHDQALAAAGLGRLGP